MACVYKLQKAASGLLVIARTEEAQTKLQDMYKQGDMQMEMHVMCHGQVPSTLLDAVPKSMDCDFVVPEEIDEEEDIEEDIEEDVEEDIEEDIEEDVEEDIEEDIEEEQHIDPILPSPLFKVRPFPPHLIHSYTVHTVTRSNQANYLSSLSLSLSSPCYSADIRRLFYAAGCPIVGKSIYTRYLKSSSKKGLCMSLTRIHFLHPFTHLPIDVHTKEPGKFEHLRQREDKFWQKRRQEEQAQVKAAGRETVHRQDTYEPLAYVLGEKSFYGLSFNVSRACLVPRPSSEILVDAVLRILQQTQGKRILDIGTGCGNLLLSILHHSSMSQGVGVDISAAALEIAKVNAHRLLLQDHTQFVCVDIAQMETPSSLYDVIVCNPPYLHYKTVQKNEQQMAKLSYEPKEALFADEEGFAFYRLLHAVVPRLLHSHGRVVLECGKDRVHQVQSIWVGWRVIEINKDRQGWDRCLVLEKED
ncbi:S-adenosyl-L-methionine-dependent methyltransferase [Spinellus fusiger]|nr:S-adenosyl-L-methionine-dependent methyltransferase [Spinellus fusiger]